MQISLLSVPACVNSFGRWVPGSSPELAQSSKSEAASEYSLISDIILLKVKVKVSLFVT